MLAFTFIPAEIDNAVLFLALGSLSAMIFSLAKAGFGGSSGMLAVPLMIFACGGDVRLATGIVLPVLIAADYVAVISWLGKWNWRAVWMLLPATVVGIAAGWAILHALGRFYADDGRQLANAWLKISVGLIALAFVALRGIRRLRGRDLALRPGLHQASLAGAAAGVTSTLAHSAGPVVTMYLLPQQMPKGQFVACNALFFWIANQVKLVPYLAEDMVNTATLGAGLVLLPAVTLGAVLGIVLHKKVDQVRFTAVVYVLLALAGAWLCYQGARTLLH